MSLLGSVLSAEWSSEPMRFALALIRTYALRRMKHLRATEETTRTERVVWLAQLRFLERAERQGVIGSHQSALMRAWIEKNAPAVTPRVRKKH